MKISVLIIMKKLINYIASQFKTPRGLIGKICCLGMNIINKKMYRNVLKNLVADSCLKILDIGYGNGYLIKKMYAKTKADIYGTDISESMYKAASRRNRKSVKQGKVRLLTGDCCNLDFENNTFDIVTSVNSIYFWESPIKGMQEINRVLKTNGVFINCVYSKSWLQYYQNFGYKLFEKEELIQLGKKSGFSNVSVNEIVKGKSYLILYTKTAN